MSKQKRQVGSEKLWLDEKEGLFWCSVILHDGRTSRQFNGPRAMTQEDARNGLNEQVRKLSRRVRIAV